MTRHTGLAFCILLLAGFFPSCGEQAKEKREEANKRRDKERFDVSSASSSLSDSLFMDLSDSAMLARTTVNDTVFSDSAYDESYWIQGILGGSSDGGAKLNSGNDPAPPYNYFLPIDSGLKARNIDLVFGQLELEENLKNKYAGYSAQFKVLIGPNGKPKDYRVVSSPDFAVTKKVINKIRHLHYDPAYLDGKPVFRWVNIEYRIG